MGTWYFLVPTRKYPKKLSTGTALANHYYNSTQARKLAKRHPAFIAGSKYFTAQTIHAYEDCFGYSYCSLRYRGICAV